MTGKRVATYARFSSNQQREESIDAQERAMRKYCEDNGYTIVASYRDKAKSATTDNRPQFLQAIADSEKREFDLLLTYNLSRFARNRYDSAIYRSKLKKNGVEVRSVSENLDGSPESIILEALLEGMSEYYSRNLAREVMKGLMENAYVGKHTGGIPPYGFTVDENLKLIINEDEAPAIRIAYMMFARGSGYTQILKTLDAKGYKTRKGMPFSKAWLNSIFQNEKYKGIYVYRKQNPRRNSFNYGTKTEMIRVPNGCPKIVSEELFDKVQQQMKVNRYYNLNYSDGDNQTVNLLRGITFCGECGKRMVVNSRRGGRNKNAFFTYRCPNKNHVCSNREFNRDHLESYAIMLAEKHLFNKDAMDNSVKAVMDAIEQKRRQTEQRIVELATQLDTISKAIGNTVSALEQTGMAEILAEKLNALETEKREVENEARQCGVFLAQLREDIDGDEILDYYDEVKNSGNRQEYRAVLIKYLDSVTIFANHVVIRLRTGLGMMEELDTQFDVKRGEIYQFSGSRVYSA